MSQQVQEPSLIEAAWCDDRKLLAAVEVLRASGERVVFALPTATGSDDVDSSTGVDKGVSRKMHLNSDGDWVVVNTQAEQLPK